jgi:hypothetical protein
MRSAFPRSCIGRRRIGAVQSVSICWGPYLSPIVLDTLLLPVHNSITQKGGAVFVDSVYVGTKIQE